MKWIRDREFIRGRIPMTKFNIRALNMAYLSIKEGDRFLDIGAGTGSIAIEAALQGAKTWAIEREKEGIQLIEANCQKFQLDIRLIRGQAPKDLPDLEFNKCFIGGSGGKLGEIFQYLDQGLLSDGILCANFIMLRNLNEFLDLIEKHSYKDVEVQLIQSSYMDEIGLMRGQNPIYIVKGVKA